MVLSAKNGVRYTLSTTTIDNRDITTDITVTEIVKQDLDKGLEVRIKFVYQKSTDKFDIVITKIDLTETLQKPIEINLKGIDFFSSIETMKHNFLEILVKSEIWNDVS